MKIKKSGRLWCGGARETREPRVTTGKIVNKTETTIKQPAFQDLSGISMIKPIILCTTGNFFGTIVIF